jgi:hypothetical protein
MKAERISIVKRNICARLFILLLLLLIASASAFAQANCLSYDPAQVNVMGTILRKTFPGPPNYESVRRGDKPETIWILHLDNPVCVTGNTDEINQPERRLTDLQLALDGDEYTRFRKFIGGQIRVQVTGKLFHAHTAHHRTSVLLEVENIKKSN